MVFRNFSLNLPLTNHQSFQSETLESNLISILMKKFYTFALLAMAVGSAAAAPLSPAEAWTRANNDSRMKAHAKVYDTTPVYTLKTAKAAPAAYVFSADKNGGFMIVSADDVAIPVLGYSDKGDFDINNIPTQMKWWLDEYARQIEWASEKGLTYTKAPVNPEWTAVAPLCTTKWDQSAPYNSECPIDKRNSSQCVTGCVATSMAQAIKYFNYPVHGQGSISYYAQNAGNLSLNFADVSFDWDNMLDVYTYGKYNDTEAKAVGTLMKACGYAVEMNYGSDASGASGSDIAKALRTYFNYDGNCRTEYRMMYSMSTWQSMIYDNVKNIGPVIINGRDPGDMGHSFILDGYDGHGYFHLNWGWGGMSDGYFALDALNPDAMGIGGYGSGFNYGQNAILGIQPPTGQPVTPTIPNLVQSGNLAAKVSGNRISLDTSDYYINNTQGWFNQTDSYVVGKFGVRLQPISGDGESTIVDATRGSSSVINLAPSSGYGSIVKISATLPSVADGKYKATLMVKPEGYDWQEILVPWGFNNYVYLDKSGSSWNVSYPDWGHISIESASIASELYNGFNILVKAKFVNSSNLEITQGLTACLMSGSTFKFLGPNILITLQPNETIEKDMVIVFNPMSGTNFVSPTDYTLRFIDRETNASYGDFGTYTMTTGPKSTSLTRKKLEIANASAEMIDYAQTQVYAYKVNDTSDITVDFSYSVRAGYFDKIVRMNLYKVSPESLAQLTLVDGINPIYSEMPFLGVGEVSENEVKISLPNAEDGDLYAIRAEYGGAYSWKNLGSNVYFIKSTAGVKDILVDSESVEYFNLQGIKVANPVPGQILIRRIGSKTEKVIF